MSVHLRAIDADNFIEAMRLRVSPEQETFVATNAASIAQSKFHAHLECYGVFDGDTMVGFSVCGVNPDDGTVWIARHMVGAQFQRQGYGRAGLHCLIAHLRSGHGMVPIYLDVAPSNAAAISLYESAGFRDAGLDQGKSRVYCLEAEKGAAGPKAGRDGLETADED